jgi:hypothetical protein
MNANEQVHQHLTINLAEERFQWACALAYAYDVAQSDPDKAQEIRKAWSLYHRAYWSPMVAGAYRREKPEVPDYPDKVNP